MPRKLADLAPTKASASAPRKKSASAPRKKSASPAPEQKRSPGSAKVSAAVADKLALYQQKRAFDKTPEPSGTARRKKARSPALPAFVVQKHAARNLHYDFRLEIDGVLVSWAVPKGPSTDVSEKRLAVRTEDHPLAYLDFEGTIPEGSYGAGHVIVWDIGTFEAEGDARAGLEKGHLKVTLHGKKLIGSYHLVRTKRPSKTEQWLLMRAAHDGVKAPQDPVKSSPESALSGRRLPEDGPAKPEDPRSSAQRQLDLVQMVKTLGGGLEFTNLDKVLYPDVNLRKAELIAYFACAATAMLPYVSGRPLTLVRSPDGVGHASFFQKHPAKGTPSVIGRVRVEEAGGTEEYMTVDDMRGLMATAQLGALELHVWGCHRDDIESPDELVIDIDPDETLPWEAVVQAARDTRARLGDLGLVSFVKTTGGKGLHVVVPLQKGASWDLHKDFSLALTESMAKAEPKRFVVNARKALRTGKIFLDYLRNGRSATYIAPYSPRARVGATVATPITWQELDDGVTPGAFDVRTVVARIDRQERDPWDGYFAAKQRISEKLVRAVRGKVPRA